MPTSPNLHADYHFILNCFGPSDIDGVIEDMELEIKGYKFLYALDTYDIMENYLPYIQIELFSKSDKHLQAQKYICYDYFFNGMNKTNCILLNEYKIELVAAKNKLTRYLKDARTVIKNLDDLKRETDDFLKNPEKAQLFFDNHFEVILLLLILNDKTYSILDEFFAFISSRLNTKEIKVEKAYDGEKIENLFNQTVPTGFSIELFQEYINQNKKLLLTVKNENERHIFLENTFRDIQAIERLMEINQSLQKINLKYSIIYLSSARKTNEIFKSLENLKENKNPNTSLTTKTFHRNIYQYFLFDRLRSEFKHDHNKALTLLKDLRALICRISAGSANGEEDADQVQILALVKRLFDEKSSVLDNHFYYSVYDKYKTSFNKHSKSNSGQFKDQERMQIIHEIDKNKEVFKSKIFALEFALSQLNQTYEVVDTFWGMEDYEPEYRFGKDIIRNPYQHLPILLLVKGDFDPALKNKLYAFLSVNVEVSELNKPVIQSYVKDIVKQLYALNPKNIYSKSLKSLIITYLNFVAQNKYKSNIGNINPPVDEYQEDKIIFDLEKQYEIIKFQFSRVDHHKTLTGNKLEYDHEHKELLIEIVYILLWLYRRNLKPDEGIKKGLDILKESDDDPRILQGIALCYISKLYSRLIETNDQPDQPMRDHLDSSLTYMNAAQKTFESGLGKEISKEANLLNLKNYIGVLNSLADLNLRKYIFQSDKNDRKYLELARDQIDKVRFYFTVIRLDYDDHPIYSATEVEIQYHEALYFKSEGSMALAHKKVIDAIMRASLFRKMSKPDSYVDRVFGKINERLNHLATTIFQELKKQQNG
jgi:hypothetical protein